MSGRGHDQPSSPPSLRSPSARRLYRGRRTASRAQRLGGGGSVKESPLGDDKLHHAGPRDAGSAAMSSSPGNGAALAGPTSQGLPAGNSRFHGAGHARTRAGPAPSSPARPGPAPTDASPSRGQDAPEPTQVQEPRPARKQEASPGGGRQSARSARSPVRALSNPGEGLHDARDGRVEVPSIRATLSASGHAGLLAAAGGAVPTHPDRTRQRRQAPPTPSSPSHFVRHASRSLNRRPGQPAPTALAGTAAALGRAASVSALGAVDEAPPDQAATAGVSDALYPHSPSFRSPSKQSRALLARGLPLSAAPPRTGRGRSAPIMSPPARAARPAGEGSGCADNPTALAARGIPVVDSEGNALPRSPPPATTVAAAVEQPFLIVLRRLEGHLPELRRVFEYYCGWARPTNALAMSSLQFRRLAADCGLLSGNAAPQRPAEEGGDKPPPTQLPTRSGCVQVLAIPVGRSAPPHSSTSGSARGPWFLQSPAVDLAFVASCSRQQALEEQVHSASVGHSAAAPDAVNDRFVREFAQYTTPRDGEGEERRGPQRNLSFLGFLESLCRLAVLDAWTARNRRERDTDARSATQSSEGPEAEEAVLEGADLGDLGLPPDGGEDEEDEDGNRAAVAAWDGGRAFTIRRLASMTFRFVVDTVLQRAGMAPPAGVLSADAYSAEVVAVFAYEQRYCERIFAYFTGIRGPHEAALMAWPQWKAFLAGMQLCPEMVGHAASVRIFRDSCLLEARAATGERPLTEPGPTPPADSVASECLTFAGFLEALTRCAVVAFSGPSLAETHPTVLHKVGRLFEWLHACSEVEARLETLSWERGTSRAGGGLTPAQRDGPAQRRQASSGVDGEDEGEGEGRTLPRRLSLTGATWSALHGWNSNARVNTDSAPGSASHHLLQRAVSRELATSAPRWSGGDEHPAAPPPSAGRPPRLAPRSRAAAHRTGSTAGRLQRVERAQVAGARSRGGQKAEEEQEDDESADATLEPGAKGGEDAVWPLRVSDLEPRRDTPPAAAKGRGAVNWDEEAFLRNEEGVAVFSERRLPSQASAHDLFQSSLRAAEPVGPGTLARASGTASFRRLARQRERERQGAAARRGRGRQQAARPSKGGGRAASRRSTSHGPASRGSASATQPPSVPGSAAGVVSGDSLYSDPSVGDRAEASSTFAQAEVASEDGAFWLLRALAHDPQGAGLVEGLPAPSSRAGEASAEEVTQVLDKLIGDAGGGGASGAVSPTRRRLSREDQVLCDELIREIGNVTGALDTLSREPWSERARARAQTLASALSLLLLHHAEVRARAGAPWGREAQLLAARQERIESALVELALARQQAAERPWAQQEEDQLRRRAEFAARSGTAPDPWPLEAPGLEEVGAVQETQRQLDEGEVTAAICRLAEDDGVKAAARAAEGAPAPAPWSDGTRRSMAGRWLAREVRAASKEGEVRCLQREAAASYARARGLEPDRVLWSPAVHRGASVGASDRASGGWGEGEDEAGSTQSQEWGAAEDPASRRSPESDAAEDMADSFVQSSVEAGVSAIPGGLHVDVPVEFARRGPASPSRIRVAGSALHHPASPLASPADMRRSQDEAAHVERLRIARGKPPLTPSSWRHLLRDGSPAEADRRRAWKHERPAHSPRLRTGERAQRRQEEEEEEAVGDFSGSLKAARSPPAASSSARRLQAALSRVEQLREHGAQ